MSTKVSVSHKSLYSYDRLISFSTHTVRLKPAPHARVPIHAYSLSIRPAKHFLSWQQDPFGNYVANVNFLEKSDQLAINVDLIIDLSALNPLDFVIPDYAKYYPFKYEPRVLHELEPYFQREGDGPLFRQWLNGVNIPPTDILDYLSQVNSLVKNEFAYTIRLEPGVQNCEETLQRGSGSCRDLSWFLIQALRNFGIAARFVSGYLVQLKPGDYFANVNHFVRQDTVDLHAWVEVYLPGAGWVGLDPTSAYFSSEGHIPLSCTPSPENSAPVSGFTEECDCIFSVEMSVERLDILGPRTINDHYSEDIWCEINQLGEKVDADLQAHDVRLTMGAEPTFVSVDNQDALEWQFAADGLQKRALANDLIRRLHWLWAPHGLLHIGQGKNYAGEDLPRWVYSSYWLKDGRPLWKNQELLANERFIGISSLKHAEQLAIRLCEELRLDRSLVQPAYEDTDLAQLLQGIDIRRTCINEEEPVGMVLPLSFDHWSGRFKGGTWNFERQKLYLLAGTSSIGYRLPLPLIRKQVLQQQAQHKLKAEATISDQKLQEQHSKPITTALCIEVRRGNIFVFFPPLDELDHYMALLDAVAAAAEHLSLPVIIEGYHPPTDANLVKIQITPDPGVIEVNIFPSADWQGLKNTIMTLYEEARAVNLTTERFLIDGRHVGTGGGNHLTIGGPTLADSPVLRRPDLLRSLLTYLQHHPSLSYFFSGQFVGPTSQAPRPDEGRHEKLYELEIAFSQMPQHPNYGYWQLDRIFRNLLMDSGGNIHRAEISIDKLYSPSALDGRQGLLEFRGFEMMPHPHMCLLQMLFMRALVAYFWQVPYTGNLVRWGTELHDKFMLPHYLWHDFADVVSELAEFGYDFKLEWFEPFFELRFPRYGSAQNNGLHLELRMALEAWNVLGEENIANQSSRMVDSSTERIQLKASGLTPGRHVITCNQRRVPLQATGRQGEYVAGIRFKARNLTFTLHPHMPPNAPLVFDIYDTWARRSVGGFTYHADHPAGLNYVHLPLNAVEAEARLSSRFQLCGYSPFMNYPPLELADKEFPYTLDLRRPPVEL